MELKRKNENPILVVKEYTQLDKNKNPYQLPLLHYPILDQTGIVYSL